VAVGLSTPVGSYPLNVTGIDTSSPPIQRQVIVTLDVIMDNGDFSVCVSPNSLTFNAFAGIFERDLPQWYISL